MTDKFTPGDWIQGSDPHPLSRNAILIASNTPDGERVLICEVHEFVPPHLRDADVDDCTREEARANAALITASKDLLAACNRVVNNWGNLHPKDRQQLQAAIAKARVEQ